jgi:hypothetical protein
VNSSTIHRSNIMFTHCCLLATEASSLTLGVAAVAGLAIYAIITRAKSRRDVAAVIPVAAASMQKNFEMPRENALAA